MPNIWLLKTEPSTYSYADLERDRRTTWDGVRNPAALKFLRAMKAGDIALIYHTGEERQIVGIAEVAKDAYADPKHNDPKLAVVDLEASQRLPKPVTLAAIKSQKVFAGFELVRQPRLSVMPVPAAVVQKLMAMAR